MVFAWTRPYLVERGSHVLRKHSETHAVSKKLRVNLDKYFPGKMLLAEANQCPPTCALLRRRR